MEGMRNERIVATACMYLEKTNCTESKLSFRTAVREPKYEQNDGRGVEKMYGLFCDKPLLQRRGASRTLPGRILAWPNTLQHRVSNFELADKKVPGRRTILSFFLVDPNLRVRSTATVPPQSKKWQEVENKKMVSKIDPADDSGRVVRNLDGISFEDACERRLRLMEERKKELIIEAVRVKMRSSLNVCSICASTSSFLEVLARNDKFILNSAFRKKGPITKKILIYVSIPRGDY